MAASRKIAILSPLYFDDESYIGGGERYALNLALGVVGASGGRIRAELISYGAKSYAREIRPGVSVRILQVARKPDHPLDPVSWQLPGALADADLVHIQQLYTRSTEMAILVAKQLRKPVVVTDHGAFSSSLGTSLGLYELVDHVMAYSDFGASLYPKGKPIAVIKGGVDASDFVLPEVRPARDRIVYVGRLLPHKGIDRLVRALPQGVLLTICGRPYHQDYFRHLQYLAEGKRVEFVTDAHDTGIKALYARAWANVLPSVYTDIYGTPYVAPDLMGLTLLEAMACGTPAICSRVGGMQEFVQHGRTGYVFDTVEELSQQLTRLATTPGLADRMGSQARELVENEFDLQVVGRKLAALYDRVIDARREVAA